MPYKDKEVQRAYNRRWREERMRGDPVYQQKEADRLFNSYWKDPEKKRLQNRESYYRTRGRNLPTQFKQYRIRDPATRPEPTPKIQDTPPTPLPQIVGGGSPKLSLEPPISFNTKDLFL